MIIESSGWFHVPNRVKKTEYHYFQFPFMVSLCGGLNGVGKHLTKGNKGNINNFEKRTCTVCNGMYLNLDPRFRHTKIRLKPTHLLLVDEKIPENKWQKGACSKCGAIGVYWDGGKRKEHYCNKCLVIIAR